MAATKTKVATKMHPLIEDIPFERMAFEFDSDGRVLVNLPPCVIGGLKFRRNQFAYGGIDKNGAFRHYDVPKLLRAKSGYYYDRRLSTKPEPASQKVLHGILTPFVNQWLSANPNAIKQASTLKSMTDFKSKKASLPKLEKKLADNKRQVEALQVSIPIMEAELDALKDAVAEYEANIVPTVYLTQKQVQEINNYDTIAVKDDLGATHYIDKGSFENYRDLDYLSKTNPINTIHGTQVLLK